MTIEEEIADEISGIQVGSGYYATTIGIDAAREAVEAIAPLLNRVRAEALREVAVVIDAFSGTCLNASSAADIITATADRIEQNSEGNET